MPSVGPRRSWTVTFDKDGGHFKQKTPVYITCHSCDQINTQSFMHEDITVPYIQNQEVQVKRTFDVDLPDHEHTYTISRKTIGGAPVPGRLNLENIGEVEHGVLSMQPYYIQTLMSEAVPYVMREMINKGPEK